MEWFEDLPKYCPPSDAEELRLDKILDFYDEPQLFMARDKFDAQYICLLYDDADAPTYTAVRISNERLADFLAGKTDFRKLFTDPEVKGEYYDVSYNNNRLVIAPLDIKSLPEDRLPQDGYTLDSDSQGTITVHLPLKGHGLFIELFKKFGWACM